MNAKEFTSSIGFIVFVLIAVLAVVVSLGEKVATYALWLILLGMLIVNADKVTGLLSRYSTPKQTPKISNDPPASGSPEWNKIQVRGGFTA